MVELKNKEIIINGKPIIIMCGEIHYFRLKKHQWKDCIDKLKLSGCNAVATYIPWICHEFEEGKIDLSGIYHEENDIISFLDLCQASDLYIIVRPGPFVMAEMKNEGIPHWVYDKYKEVVPTTWDNLKVTTKTLDYLSPNFIKQVEKWYAAIMQEISKRLINNGGKIIACQLDNEIGMLSWISNCPDLTDFIVADMSKWIISRYTLEGAKVRYGFDIENINECARNFRAPEEDIVLKYHKDLGYYMRRRFKVYVSTLRVFAEKNGVKEIPFIINIHGSGGNRGINYPYGLSQLYESYNYDDAYLPGSDYYIGEVNIGNFQDIYLANAFTDCMNSNNQPLSSMEFEAGDMNYGDNFDYRVSPSAVDIKTRIFMAQGNKLINYYLFSGGENYRFHKILKDGNDRIAITGQKHGFAAPIGPTGKLNSTFEKMSEVIHVMMACNESIATMREEHDNMAFAFIPDYYMLEYNYPKSIADENMKNEITAIRDNGMWSVLAKSLLLTGHRFSAIDIQNKNLKATLKNNEVLVISTAKYLSREIQNNIINYIQAGNNAFIYGELPQYDMEGNSCTLLVGFLGCSELVTLRQTPNYYRSVYPCGDFSEYPEIIAYEVQTVKVKNAKPFLRLYENDEVVGFEKKINNSKVTVLLTHFHSNLPMLKELFSRTGIKSGLYHDCEEHGILLTSCSNDMEERFIHIINLDDFQKTFSIYEEGKLLFKETIMLKRKEGLMLPINLKLNQAVTIEYATAEVYGINNNEYTFRLTQDEDTIVLVTGKTVCPMEGIIIKKFANKLIIKINSKRYFHRFCTLILV